MLLDGQAIDSLPSHRRACAGLVRSFQGLELFPEMTVLENLQVPHDRNGGWQTGRELVRPTKTTLSPVAMAAVQDFGLGPILHKSPDEISYGQRRLVAIARAVAAEPSVLLLDEPVAGLSEHESGEFAHLVRRLADTWGMAVLVIEHDMNFVMSICDRITRHRLREVRLRGFPRRGARESRCSRCLFGRRVRSIGVRARTGSLHPSVEDGAGMSTTPLLEARHLSCGYGAVEIVRDLMLEVRSGEVVALLGANGAGKTTTLLTLAGELNPLGGEVLFSGNKSSAPLYKRARAGMAFVTEETLDLPGPHDKAEPGCREGRCHQGGFLVPGADATDVAPRRPALGRRAANAHARARARPAARPAAGRRTLTRSGAKDCHRLLRAVRCRALDGGIGALLVEQYVHRVLEIADRVYLLHRGQIEFSGNGAEARANINEIQATYLAGPKNAPK